MRYIGTIWKFIDHRFLDYKLYRDDSIPIFIAVCDFVSWGVDKGIKPCYDDIYAT